jgi:acetyl-CoA acyltransferase
MKPNRRVFVVGGAHSPFLGRGRPEFIWKGHPDYGVKTNPNLEEHMQVATLGAFEATGVSAADIEKAYVSNFLGECFSRQGHLGSMLADVHPDLEGIPIARIEAACASGSAAIAACVDAMQGGVDVTMVVGVEVETNASTRDGIDYMARAAHYEQSRDWDSFTFPYVFARRAKHYKEAFGATNMDLGQVVAKAYGNASLNPLAQMQAVQVEAEWAATTSDHNAHFLSHPDYREHIKQADCTTFTDGGSAVILATEDGLGRLGIPRSQCTEILAYGHSVAGLGKETDPTRLTNMARAARTAYSDADVEPSAVEVVEVHDCFSINELQHYEALGLCGWGEAPDLLKSGATAIGGRVPVNTGGGLLGFGHPIGATGVKQVLEVWRQMKGQCGDYQMPSTPSLGVTANLGGDDRTGIVMVHRNCA